MKLLVQYTISITLLLILGQLNTQAQVVESFNNYYVRVDQGNATNTSYEVIIYIAADASNGSRKLGSSNLQILFDNQFLANPTLSSSALSAAYNSVTVTQPKANKASFNVSLATPGTGMAIATYPAYTEIGRIVFDITTHGNGSFIWTDNVFDTKETVVYFDDEATLRHPVQMTNLQNTTFELDLQSFDAAWKTKNQNDAIITWITATEDGTTSFEVERSFNGVDGWETVGSLSPKGGSNYGAEYSFEDTQVSFYMPELTVYYRLKEVNVTGIPTFSDTRVLQRTVPKERNFISAYPNPVVDQLIVEFNINSQTSGDIELYVVAADGRKVYEATFDQGQARNISIQTSDFPTGVYAVFVHQGNQSLVQKVVKRP